jgi:superoxide dismutase, Fe-Mn family
MMTSELDRRSFVQASSALTAGAAVTAAMWPAEAAAQTPPQPGAGAPPQPAAAPKPRTFEIKPMPFDPKKIKGISEKMLTSHYENNYGGAVKRLNAILEQIASLDYAKAPGFQINGLKREELIATNSMILHELYFNGLGSEESRPGEALNDALARDFGSVDRWRAEFVAMGKAEGGGSGWVLLNWEPRYKRLVNAWAADHTTTLAGGQPILALDMYEHAYQMDYGAKAGDYVDAFMRAIRWNNADMLFAQYS